jgi:hypothetical protein
MSVDLETRLRDAMRETADRVIVPEDLPAAVDRHVARRRRQAGAARLAVAAVVTVALGVTAVVVRDGGEGAEPATSDDEIGRWDPLPEAPIDPRFGAGAVWTGEEMLVFGGSNATEVDGAAAYDPDARTWRELADAPDGLAYVTAVWTGREAVAFSRNPTDWERGRPGAVYDPGADAWRPIPDPQLGTPGEATTPVWTGERVVVTGIELDRLGALGAAAYDPATDEWTQLPSSPHPLNAPGDTVWTGDELVFVGGEPVDSGPLDDVAFVPRPMVALALDPDTGDWRTLPAPPLPAAEDTLVAWTGDEVVVVAGEADVPAGDGSARTDTVALDPASGAWRPLPRTPVAVHSPLDQPLPVVDGRLVVLVTEDPERRPLVLDPDVGGWTFGPSPDVPEALSWSAVAAGDRVLVWGGLSPFQDVAGEDPAAEAAGPGGYAFTPDG